MKICKVFDWNLSMMTFYDYLEQFLAQGCIFEDDVIILSDSAQENQDFREREYTPDNKIKGPLDKTQSPYYTPSPQESQLLRIGLRGNQISPQGNINEQHKTPSRFIRARELELNNRNSLIERIVSSALQIACKLAESYLTDSWRQREVAYLILVMARRANNLKMPDQHLFKELYKIKSQIDFYAISEVHITNFPLKSIEDFDFDTVERNYDQEGNLISDFGKKKSQTATKKTLFKSKVVLQTQNSVTTISQNTQLVSFSEPAVSTDKFKTNLSIPKLTFTHNQNQEIQAIQPQNLSFNPQNLYQSELQASGLGTTTNQNTQRSLNHSGINDNINNSGLNYSNSGVVLTKQVSRQNYDNQNSSSKQDTKPLFISQLQSQLVDLSNSQIDLSSSNPGPLQGKNQVKVQQPMVGIEDRGNLPSNRYFSNLSLTNQSTIPRQIIEKYTQSSALKNSAISSGRQQPVQAKHFSVHNFSSVQPGNINVMETAEKSGQISERLVSNNGFSIQNQNSGRVKTYSDVVKLQFGQMENQAINPSILKTNYFDLKKSKLTRRSNPNQRNVFMKFHPNSEKSLFEGKISKNEKISIDGAVNHTTRLLSERNHSIQTIDIKNGKLDNDDKLEFNPNIISNNDHQNANQNLPKNDISLIKNSGFLKNFKNAKKFEIQTDQHDQANRPILVRTYNQSGQPEINNFKPSESQLSTSNQILRDSNPNPNTTHTTARSNYDSNPYNKIRTYSQNPSIDVQANPLKRNPIIQTTSLNFMGSSTTNSQLESNLNSVKNNTGQPRLFAYGDTNNSQNIKHSNSQEQNKHNPLNQNQYSHREALIKVQKEMQKMQQQRSDSSRKNFIVENDHSDQRRLSEYRISHPTSTVTISNARVNESANNTPLKFDVFNRVSESNKINSNLRNVYKTQSQNNILNLNSNRPLSKNGSIGLNGYVQTANAMFNIQKKSVDVNGHSISEYGTLNKPHTPSQLNFHNPGPSQNYKLTQPQNSYLPIDSSWIKNERQSVVQRIEPANTIQTQYKPVQTNYNFQNVKSDSQNNLKQGSSDQLTTSLVNQQIRQQENDRDNSLLGRRYIGNKTDMHNKSLSHNIYHMQDKKYSNQLSSRDLSIGSQYGLVRKTENQLTLNNSSLNQKSRPVFESGSSGIGISQQTIENKYNVSLNRMNSTPVIESSSNVSLNQMMGGQEYQMNFSKFGQSEVRRLSNSITQMNQNQKNPVGPVVNQYGLRKVYGNQDSSYLQNQNHNQVNDVYGQTRNIVSKSQLEQNINRVKKNVNQFH